MEMITFTPTAWAQVKAYCTIVFNLEINPERKPRLRRLVLTGAPYSLKDVYAVEEKMVSLVGYHITKAGNRSKAHRSYRDDYFTVRLSQVVSVTQYDSRPSADLVWDEAHAENRARTAVADGTARRHPAPSRLMERAIASLTRDGYIDPIAHQVGTNTIVALMDRGFIRESKGRAGRHYPATTPEQVYDEARAEYREVTRAAREADSAAYQRQLAAPNKAVAKSGIEVGDSVQRTAEVGPDRPVGEVLAMAPSGGSEVFLVSFSGLPGLRMRAEDLVKVQPEACPVHGGRSHRACEAYPAPCTPDKAVGPMVVNVTSINAKLAEIGRGPVGGRKAEEPGRPNDVTLLHRFIVKNAGGTVREVSDALLSLGRLVEAQPATNLDGNRLWLHPCGRTYACATDPQQSPCICGLGGTWRALFVGSAR